MLGFLVKIAIGEGLFVAGPNRKHLFHFSQVILHDFLPSSLNLDFLLVTASIKLKIKRILRETATFASKSVTIAQTSSQNS